jgi:hypothetical protein
MRTKLRVNPWIASAVVVAIINVLGCEAAAPRGSQTMTLPAPKAIEPADLKVLAGKWTGSGKSPAGTARIETVLSDDGSFYSVGSLTGDQKFPGRMQIREGKVFYETTYSSGTMIFHELADQWVWKWEGKTRDGGPVANELVKAKR